MTTDAIDLAEGDTLRVARAQAAQRPPRPRRPSRRLSEMNLDPPEGPVPADVISYFEAALERADQRQR